MIKKYVLVLSMVAVFASCAWKKKEDSISAPTTTTPQTETEPTKTKVEGDDKKITALQELSLTVEWPSNVGKSATQLTRTISEKKDQSKDFYLENPLTLPAVVPNEIDIDLQGSKLNPSLKDTFILSMKVDSSDLNLKQNSLVVTPDHLIFELVDGGPHLKFKINGLRNVLSDNEQQRLFLTVDIRNSASGLKLATLYFSLITPPQRVFLEQKTLSEVRKGPGIESLGLRELQSPAKKLELIQVIKAQNRSGENVSVDVPVQITGKLWQKRRWFYPQPKLEDKERCLETSTVRNLDIVFSESFYVFPLSEDLKKEWISHLTQNIVTLGIPAGKDRMLGVFAEVSDANTNLRQQLKESRLTEYYQNNYRYPPSNKAINTKCDFGCTNPETGHPGFPVQCEDIPAEHPDWKIVCEERVAACLPCIAKGQYPRTQTSIVWGSECNRCHDLEVLEGLNRRFDYHGIKACVDDWRMTALETKEVPDGHLAENVMLDLNKDKIKAFVRFDFSDREDDPEGREFDFLKSSSIYE